MLLIVLSVFSLHYYTNAVCSKRASSHTDWFSHQHSTSSLCCNITLSVMISLLIAPCIASDSETVTVCQLGGKIRGSGYTRCNTETHSCSISRHVIQKYAIECWLHRQENIDLLTAQMSRIKGERNRSNIFKTCMLLWNYRGSGVNVFDRTDHQYCISYRSPIASVSRCPLWLVSLPETRPLYIDYIDYICKLASFCYYSGLKTFKDTLKCN